MALETRDAFMILGSTGCSCCRHENFAEGFWDTYNEAETRVASHRERRTVSSQYSSTGIYEIRTVKMEIIDDNRVIIGDRVLEFSPGGHYMEFGEDIYTALGYSFASTCAQKPA